MRRLDEDPRVADALRAGAWHAIDHHTAVTSTQDVALAALHRGVEPGLVVVADVQTAGRGRAGRSWQEHAPHASGLANLSVTATWPVPPGVDVGVAPLAAGLAVVGSLRPIGVDTLLKWPNDVLAAERKIAGILVERHRVGEHDVLLVGCGIDLDWRQVGRAGASTDWTSVAEVTGRDVDRAEVLAGLLVALDDRLDQVRHDPALLLDDHRRVCVTLGRDVQVHLPGGDRLDGRAIDVDTSGGLILETRDGRRRTVTVGDVVHVR